jgi:RNA polymerase sigma-70 factor, ECF subfamily
MAAVTMSETLVRVGDRMDDVAAAYAHHHADLFGYAASLARSPSAAEDLVHEAFARLVTERARGRWPDDPRAWLFRVCTNLAVSGARRRVIVERWQQLVGRPAARAEQAEAADTIALRRERNSEIGRALGRLPAEHRAALLLAAEGFRGRELAAILGRSEGATRNILWRARLGLREAMGEAGRP